MYINKVDFLQSFPQFTLEAMKRKHCQMIQLDYIANSIDKYYKERRMRSQAVLDAAQLNPVNLYSDRKLPGDDAKIGKLKPWLKNALNYETKSKKLNEEINRVTTLATKTEFLVHQNKPAG